MKKPLRIKPVQWVLHIVLSLGAVVMVFPFLWTLSSSLKTPAQIFQIPPIWLPNPVQWENFIRTLEVMPFDAAYFNSFYITVVVVISQVFFCSLAAYAFAKFQFPGDKFLFLLVISMMMVPKQVIIVPQYLMLQQFGWVDTHWALIMPELLFKAFGIFLLRQFIMGIPRELEEAAIVDGAHPLRIWWSVIFPLIRPALAAFAIFAFKDMWNQFLEPLIYLNSPQLFTVPMLLNSFKGLYTADWALMMAGAVISILPILIVYVILQRQIIEGIALTGMKG
ncbi:carbohydrate ABC transporter permease [Paludifilum halophilum]|nr:carbohydrate ABC transporter permease [Paludifilum halophilum]